MENLFSDLAVTLLMSFIGLITTVVKSFKFVQEGEEGCKLQFGKVLRDKEEKPIIIKPGFVLLIPWVETLKRRHVRQQTMRFDRQEIFIAGELVFIVSAIVRFRVRDIYKALFEVDALDDCISDRCMGVLRDVLQEKKHDEMRHTEKISQELLTLMKVMEDEWGVEFLDARLTSCAPTQNSAQILSSSTSAELKAKAALDAAEKLGGKPVELQGILSAIVGAPVATNASMHLQPVNRSSSNGKSEEEDE